MQTQIFKTVDDVEKAAGLIRAGGLVAVPTETVYGLAANGLDAAAVEKIFEVKGRPETKPLSLMVPDASYIDRFCKDVPDAAYQLAERYWPGPLTIVLPSNGTAPDIVTAGGWTVALRCPDSPLTQALLNACGCPLAAPSANPSGKKSAKNAGEVLAYFDGAIDAVLDGGECGIGMESTIISLADFEPEILRKGALSLDHSRLRIIGITGGSGCGKTTALKELEKRGALIIDCDEVYHKLLTSDMNMLLTLEARFPGVVMGGELLRKKLGEIVFSDAEALEDLNAITHTYVGREVLGRLDGWAMRGGSLAAVDAIALLDGGLAEECEAVVGVIAPTEDRIARLMQRDGVSREYAVMRIEAQKPNSYFEEKCDYILNNDGTYDEFAEKCRILFDRILGGNKHERE